MQNTEPQMNVKKLNDTVPFPCGKTAKNRFILAPMTNTQSHEDGTLSDQELKWLEMRAAGDFGMIITCASHVQSNGKGFPGQLGIFEDRHIPGHLKLNQTLRSHNCLSIIQIFHGGMRAVPSLISGLPVSASDNPGNTVRGLTLNEVRLLRDDFIIAAARAKQAGYDGVEVHGAHGYILSQFLSSEYNLRMDEYGGSLANRSRLLLEIIHGIRTECGSDFLLAVRLSPERFGMKLLEIKQLCQTLLSLNKIDLLDISLWDSFKLPEDEAYREMTLLQHFDSFDYGKTIFTVAGQIRTGDDVYKILETNVDMVSIGRSAILHHDFPAQVMANRFFEPTDNPVSPDYLRKEGLGDAFIEYMRKRDGFVSANEY